MELILIGALTLLASGLTFVSGFGLGTLLAPILALLYPLPLAIAAAGVVHFANNLFKFYLMARFANWDVVSRFAVPGAFASVAGAIVLVNSAELPPFINYTSGVFALSVTPVGLLIGPLIIVFSLLELSKQLESLSIPIRLLPLGGVLSGFFGGLSGNQGALRAAFLMKAGLSKEEYVATSVVSAVLIDVVRLLVYEVFLIPIQLNNTNTMMVPIIVATFAALLGSFIGKQILPKVTLPALQRTIAVFMLLVGIAITVGIL